MRILHESLLRRGLRAAALRAIAWVEETNNWDPGNNGERRVLHEAIKYCKTAYPALNLTIVDVGANDGDYLRMVTAEADALGASVSIHAFEPQRQSYRQLLEAYGQEQRINLNQAALSEFDGEGVIFADRQGSPLASMYKRDLRDIDVELNQREKVNTVRLASYIKSAALEHIHFLKIDVEGSEFQVLNGAAEFLRPDFIDFIQFEYGGTNLDARVPLKAFYTLLEANGFVVAKVMQGGLRAKKYNTWMDNYMYANYVAISAETFRRLINRD